MKKTLALLLVALMVFGMFACAPQKETEAPAADSNASSPAAPASQPGEAAPSAEAATEEAPIRIGIWEPITGSMAGMAEMRVMGYQLANKLRPTCLGRPVELIYSDNKSDTVEAANSMQRLVDRGDIVGILGTIGSSLAMAGLDIAGKAEIPAIPGASNPLVTKDRPWVMRTSLADTFSGIVMAKFAAEDLGAKKIVIVENIGEDYSIGLKNFFTEAFCGFTGQTEEEAIIGVVSTNTGDTDFTAQLNVIKTLMPDAIYFPGYYSEAALFCIQMDQMGLKIPVMGTDGWEAPDLITIGGKSVEGVYISSQFTLESDRPATVKFVKQFEDEYKTEPSMYSAIGFNNYNVMLDAIEAAGDPAKNEDIMYYLRHLTNYEAVTGTVNVNPETGEAYVPCPILQIKDGQFTFVTEVDPSDLLNK